MLLAVTDTQYAQDNPAASTTATESISRVLPPQPDAAVDQRQLVRPPDVDDRLREDAAILGVHVLLHKER